MLYARLLFLLSALFVSNAWGYLDPASGSMLLTTVVSIVAGLYFIFKSFYYRVINKIASLFGKKLHRYKENVIIYSEGAQYWLLFKPLIEGLSEQKIKTLYLSSDKQDPGLAFESEFFLAQCIGKGNKAYSYLSVLEAKVVISTTPGLDVLQIKKSKGVNHYIHLIHAPSSLYKYKLFSLDYYDSIFVSGPHQIEDIRYLETLRNTHKKELYPVGCLYYDELKKELKLPAENETLTVLIAPSWDINGLLSVYGSSFIKSLLDKQMKVIVRPHPQTVRAEQHILEQIKSDLSVYSNLQWDYNISAMDAMNASDIMISDYSSITMDYLFLFKKPLIVMKFDIEYCGFEGEDLKEGGIPHWEIEVLKNVAHICEKVEDLPQLVSQMSENSDTIKQNIDDVIQSSVYNFAQAKQTATKQVIAILEKSEQ